VAEHRGRDEERQERLLSRDLQALRTRTDRDLPSVRDTARFLEAEAASEQHRSAHSTSKSREGWFMQGVRLIRVRPVLSTLVATAAVLAVLFVVPISYEKTVGHDVVLTLAANELDAESIGRIGDELGKTLGSDRLALQRRSDAVEFHASVPSRSLAGVERSAQAFVAALGSRGIAAESAVTPRIERVSSPVYAMAMDRAVQLRIDTADKSAADIEAEVRRQLEAAGIANPVVTVTKDGDQTSVEIHAQSQSPDDKRDFQFEIKGKGGQPLDPTLHRFEVKRTPGMTDAQVQADIERQMREAGVAGTVSVQNGKVEVKVEKRK
jgi:hypothetical protein